MIPTSRFIFALLGFVSLTVASPLLEERADQIKVHTGRMAPSYFGKKSPSQTTKSQTGCGTVKLGSLDDIAYAGIYYGGQYCGEYIAISYQGSDPVLARLVDTTAFNPDNIIVSNYVYTQLGLDAGQGGIDGIKWVRCNSKDPSDCPKSLSDGQEADNKGESNNSDDDDDE